MTYLQDEALRDMIDMREAALDADRASEAGMWQDIILHTWEAFSRQHADELPAYGERLLPVRQVTRDGLRIN